jgi:catechol 2,3-dioxygenase-like lactoylglutathione lyase family enzyme
MIDGAHVVIYSTNVEADRSFFRDVLGLRHVDVGGGWLIFALPDSELAVHPADVSDRHELFLICDDVIAEIDRLRENGVSCGPISDQGWGLLTSITLPGGGSLGLYQPRHVRPSP